MIDRSNGLSSLLDRDRRVGKVGGVVDAPYGISDPLVPELKPDNPYIVNNDDIAPTPDLPADIAPTLDLDDDIAPTPDLPDETEPLPTPLPEKRS